MHVTPVKNCCIYHVMVFFARHCSFPGHLFLNRYHVHCKICWLSTWTCGCDTSLLHPLWCGQTREVLEYVPILVACTENPWIAADGRVARTKHLNYSWIWRPVQTHKKLICRQTERATTDLNMYTDEKLLTRRIQWCGEKNYIFFLERYS